MQLHEPNILLSSLKTKIKLFVSQYHADLTNVGPYSTIKFSRIFARHILLQHKRFLLCLYRYNNVENKNKVETINKYRNSLSISKIDYTERKFLGETCKSRANSSSDFNKSAALGSGSESLTETSRSLSEMATRSESLTTGVSCSAPKIYAKFKKRIRV